MGRSWQLFLCNTGNLVLNRPDENFPTCRPYAGGRSWIDVTAVLEATYPRAGGWAVKEDWEGTGTHILICFKLGSDSRAASVGRLESARFNTKRVDWGSFVRCFRGLAELELDALPLETARDVEVYAETMQEKVLLVPCGRTLKRKGRRFGIHPWWTATLTKEKRNTYRIRRAAQRKREQGPNGALCAGLRRAARRQQRRYRRFLRKSRAAGWQSYVSSKGEEDPLGPVYRMAANKMRTEGALCTLRLADRHSST